MCVHVFLPSKANCIIVTLVASLASIDDSLTPRGPKQAGNRIGPASVFCWGCCYYTGEALKDKHHKNNVVAAGGL